MSDLHVTWTPEERLFVWSETVGLDHAVERDLPAIAALDGEMTRRKLASPSGGTRRTVAGYEVGLLDAIGVLSALDVQRNVSDTVRCFAYASKLALELAAEQRVAPTIRQGEARWTALLARRRDRERFEALVKALPVNARCVPTQGRGAVRLNTSRRTARAFLDACVDAVYRTNVYPGSSRGWALELAEALRGTDERGFHPREARFHAVPEMITAWSADAEADGLRLGCELRLPAHDEPRFELAWFLYPENQPDQRVSLQEAWEAGGSVQVDGRSYPHPASTLVIGLARVVHLVPSLLPCLEGPAPRGLVLNAAGTWAFLSEGAGVLDDAGFRVELPPDFQGAGSRRIRARMRVDGTHAEELELHSELSYRWEVVLGERVLTGHEFSGLLRHRAPIVPFQGAWVLLDPSEVSKLPEGLPQQGSLSAATALRAVLTGVYGQVEVVSDDRLSVMLEALRHPPAVDPPLGLTGTLRPYQREGLSWLTTLGKLGLGACLADDMGLGKTVQLIAHVLLRQETRARGPSLVVCPTSVLGNWKRELQKFAPSLSVLRYHGPSRDPSWIRGSDVVLTTYGLMVRDREILAEVCWDVVALDEAQAIKNPDSKRAKAAAELDAAHRVAMTGTPVENRLDELWSLLQFLVPGLLGPRGTFRRQVAVPVERFGDQEVAHQLKLGVSPFLLRRLKTDPAIIDDLPEKLETVDYCALKPEQARLYREVSESHLEAIGSSERKGRLGAVLAMLTALKQVCNHPAHFAKDFTVDLSGGSGKLERLMELLDDILELGEKALIFTQYRQMGDLLQRHLLENYELEVPFLHGGVPVDGREAMVDTFQTDASVPFFLVSLKAGGTGLNLTAATHVVHYDRWWNPAVEDQATDRAYRIGQDRNVQVHKMVSQGTLEERIDTMLAEKRELAVSVIGSGERWVTELDDDALRSLVMLGDDAIEEDEA